MVKRPKKNPKKIKPHQSKYSKGVLGSKYQSKLERMLNELMETEWFKSTPDYFYINLIGKNSKEYYTAVRFAHHRYLNTN